MKVKLTEHGINILQQQRKELCKAFGLKRDEYKSVVDEQGYTSFQMHDLIDSLGPYLGVGKPLPFETEIIVTKARPLHS